MRQLQVNSIRYIATSYYWNHSEKYLVIIEFIYFIPLLLGISGPGQFAANANSDCAASTTSSCSSMGSSTLACSSYISTSAKPPRRPGPTSLRTYTNSSGCTMNGETLNSRQNRKKSRVGGADLIDMVLSSKMSKNKSR